MSLPSGLARQLGFAEETTWGTPVTVDTFVPLVSESVETTIERLVSQGAIAGRQLPDVDQVKGGNVAVDGDIQIECYEQSIGTLLKHALGSASTTGGGPYTHTITPGDRTGLGLTVQLGRPRSDGTVQPFTMAGVKVPSLELSVAQGEIATMGLTLAARNMATNTSLETASYAAQATRPFTGIEATTTTWDGGAINVMNATLSVDNAAELDRRFLGSAYRSEPLQGGRLVVGGTLGLEFDSMTAWNDFAVLTFADLAVTMSNGVESLGWVAHAHLDGASPNVDGDGIVQVDVPYDVAGDGSDSDGITITYVSDDATI